MNIHEEWHNWSRAILSNLIPRVGSGGEHLTSHASLHTATRCFAEPLEQRRFVGQISSPNHATRASRRTRGCVTPLTSCTVESEIPDFTLCRRTAFVALLWLIYFSHISVALSWWYTTVNWASPQMLRLTKKQHKPYSCLYSWITSMADIPDTVLLSQAVWWLHISWRTRLSCNRSFSVFSGPWSQWWHRLICTRHIHFGDIPLADIRAF